jgi:two-component system, cell cycle response regulator DivK
VNKTILEGADYFRTTTMPKLLIVDDEPDNIELLARRLARRGFLVISATSALEGIAKAEAELPDLILMDIKMPQMDGLEATRRLKANPGTGCIPVITLTAHAMPEDRTLALAAGADDYESKPVDLNQLLAKIQVLIGSPPA